MKVDDMHTWQTTMDAKGFNINRKKTKIKLANKNTRYKYTSEMLTVRELRKWKLTWTLKIVLLYLNLCYVNQKTMC